MSKLKVKVKGSMNQEIARPMYEKAALLMYEKSALFMYDDLSNSYIVADLIIDYMHQYPDDIRVPSVHVYHVMEACHNYAVANNLENFDEQLLVSSTIIGTIELLKEVNRFL